MTNKPTSSDAKEAYGGALFDENMQLISASSSFGSMTKTCFDIDVEALSLRDLFVLDERSNLSQLRAGESLTMYADTRDKQRFLYRMATLPNDSYMVSCLNYSQRQREKDTHIGREQVLRHATEGRSLNEVMNNLVLAAEQVNPAMMGSLLMVDRHAGRLRHCAAPHLPDKWCRMVDGMRYGNGIGSCGHAAATGEDTYVDDILSHPYWTRVTELSKEVGLRSCWSTPVFDNGRNVVATFAMYSYSKRDPDAWEVAFMHTTARLAGIIVQQRRSEADLLTLATHDSLTGLINRSRFLELLTTALERCHQTPVYLLFLDLDQFKEVNDTLGHIVGDKLLQQVTLRVQNAVGGDATLGRLGGDEFAIFYTQPMDRSKLSQRAEAIVGSISKPFSIENNEIHIGGCIGVTEAPAQGDSPESVLRNADIAMYAAKDAGPNCYQFFSPEMLRKVERESVLRVELENAITEDIGLSLVYQPQIDLASGEIVGCEALCRWNHPKLGFVSPVEFIDVAERKGLMVPLGRLIIAKAVEQMSHWRNRQGFSIRMALNFSGVQFRDTEVVAEFMAMVEEAELPLNLFECELTESVLVGDVETVIATMQRLNQAGVGLSIDDFGTGYSSLSYLKQFPIQTLKIDRSFIVDVVSNQQSAQVTSAVLALGHTLGLKIVAEGAEDEDQIRFLEANSCDIVQGHYFSKPLPGDQFYRWSMTRDSAEDD